MDPLVQIDLLPKHQLCDVNDLFSGGSRRKSSIHTLHEACATGADPWCNISTRVAPSTSASEMWGGDNFPTRWLKKPNRRLQRNRAIARSLAVMERYVVGNSGPQSFDLKLILTLTNQPKLRNRGTNRVSHWPSANYQHVSEVHASLWFTLSFLP